MVMEETEKRIEQEFATAKKLVEEVLAEDKRARNSYLWLILGVWQKKQQIKIFIPYEQIGDMIAPETITRAARIIQNEECRFPPTDPKVMVRRRIREEIIRSMFGENSWEYNEFRRLKYRANRKECPYYKPNYLENELPPKRISKKKAFSVN